MRDDVILEFHRIGNAMKVSAMDPATLTEVTVQGPAHASEHLLRSVVMRKLTYALNKRGR